MNYKADTDCWIYGKLKPNTHGRFQIRLKSILIKTWPTHILSWLIFRGPIPPKMCVCHNCPGGDNPACINPEHLWLGTKAQNNADSKVKGTNAHGLKHKSVTKPFSVPRGEQHCHAKLSDLQVKKIRDAFNSGQNTRKELAVMYNVSRQYISQILLNMWRKEGPKIDG